MLVMIHLEVASGDARFSLLIEQVLLALQAVPLAHFSTYFLRGRAQKCAIRAELGRADGLRRTLCFFAAVSRSNPLC